MKKELAMRLLALAAAALIAVWFYFALGALEEKSRQEGRGQLETSLRRACAACYATEGFYPPNLDYLRQHYGIQIDERRYVVFYEVFAENLMPEITVLEREL